MSKRRGRGETRERREDRKERGSRMTQRQDKCTKQNVKQRRAAK
jgi:hypothetical protein